MEYFLLIGRGLLDSGQKSLSALGSQTAFLVVLHAAQYVMGNAMAGTAITLEAVQ